jgi:hypothetical protein
MATSASDYLSDYPQHHREFRGWSNDEMLRALVILHPTVEDAHHYRHVLWTEFLHISHVYHGLNLSVSMRLFNAVFLDLIYEVVYGGYDVDQVDLKNFFLSTSKRVIKNKAAKLEKRRRAAKNKRSE